MVGGGSTTEERGEFFRGFSAGRVDDRGAVVGRFEEVDGELVAPGFGELDDFDGEVVSTESVDEQGGIGELKLTGDIALHGWGCGGCEGDDRCGSEGRKIIAQGAVVGPEVVSPLRDAVGFVDCDERGPSLGEHLGKSGNSHAFGGDEEKLELAGEEVAAGLASFVAGETGVDAGDFEAESGELGGLVIHERDERANNESGSSAGDSGELVAEAFASTGWHNQQNVAALGGGAADSFLIGPEGRESERLVKEAGKVHELPYLRILFASDVWDGEVGIR